MERLFFLVPSLCGVGAVYFLSFFFMWYSGGYYSRHNYWYCLYVGIAFAAGTIASLVALYRCFKDNKSLIPFEVRELLLLVSMCMIILWEMFLWGYGTGGGIIDFEGLTYMGMYSMMLITLWVLCLPGVYLFLMMLYGMVKQMRGGYCLKSSLIYRLVYHFTGTDSIRSSSNIYIALSFIGVMMLLPVAGLLGAAMGNWEYTAFPEALCLIVTAAFLLEAGLMLVFINSRSSYIRNADAKVREAIEKGIASERLKVELITNVSHDLRTPMTSIVGYGEMLERMELSEEARECVQRLNHKSKYLLSMLEDVFDMSKTSTGNAVISRSDIDLVMLIKQTLAESEDRLEKIGGRLCVNMDSDSVIINTDGSRMHRVFSNLIDNAIKYSLNGTRIFVNLRTYDERVVVEIMNTSAYEMNFTPDRITERFVRGNSERTGEGSGIGLAIAKTYTEGLGGSFEIELKGDLFNAIVTLPRN